MQLVMWHTIPLKEASDLKRELYFKEGSMRNIVFFCNNIAKQQIGSALKEHNLIEWEDVMRYYRTKVIEKM